MRQAEQRLRVIKLLLIWQFIVAIAAGCVGLLMGQGGALGALAGGFIAWLPNCYFAFRAFRYKGARAARQIVTSFYAGVAGKIVITAGLFIVVFVNFEPLNAPAVFAGFLLVQTISWLVPMLVSQREVKTNGLFTVEQSAVSDRMDGSTDVTAETVTRTNQQ